MKTDDFEKRLQRQAPRQLPAAWREEILTNAQHNSDSHYAPCTTHHGLRSLIHQLLTFLRPQRAAWAGLAVVWIVILTLNFSVRDNSASVQARNLTPPSPEALAAWRQQRRELAALTETSQPREVEATKKRPPQPRSSRRDESFAA